MLETHFRPVVGRNGTVKQGVGLLGDVTERVRAEAAAADLQARLDALQARMDSLEQGGTVRTLTAWLRHLEILEEELGVARDRREQIVEVVRDTAGELADGLETLRAVQPLFTPAQRFLGAATLRHVLVRADETDCAALRIADHAANAVNRARALRRRDEELVLEARA